MSSAQDPVSQATLAVITRFNAAFNAHDVPGIMALMTTDCVFENTYPPPDGDRLVGTVAVRGFWIDLFAGSPYAHFATEEVFAMGDRAVVRWRYEWRDAGGGPGHVRGVDVFRVVDGRVAEKLSYVKG